VADWARDEMDAEADAGPDRVAEAMLSQAQEFTDAEGSPQKFLLRWVGQHDRPLKVVTHRVAPSKDADGMDAPVLAGAPSDLIVRDLLKHLDANQRHTIAAMGTITATYEKALLMLTGQLEAQLKRGRELESEVIKPTSVERAWDHFVAKHAD
jgi:hypothetical protein